MALTASKEARDSGIEPVGPMQWGSHICQFYKTRDDLLSTLVPYFAAGLAANERCMWVVSDPLTVDNALDGLRATVPDVDDRLSSGQLTVLPHDEWYLQDGVFDMDRTFSRWLEVVEDAVASGYAGVRVTGNTGWLEEKDWDDFEQYEHAISSRIEGFPILVL